MPYELYINKQRVAVFDDPDEAVARASEEVKARPDCEPEILDAATGKAFEPAASQRWRDELANKVGF